MVSYAEVLERSKRKSGTDFQTSPINTPLSKRATWILANLNINANQTTVIFFAFAMASALVFPFGTPVAVVVAAAFYWIHVILDYSDGDLARYHQQFARNGEYWDHIIHLFTIPLIFGGIVLAEVRREAPDWVIAAGIVLIVTMALNRGLNDVARVANPPEGAATDNGDAAPATTSFVKRVIRLAAAAIGADRFIIYYTIAVVFSPDGQAREWVVVASAITFLPAVLFKVVAAHRHGRLPGREDYVL